MNGAFREKWIAVFEINERDYPSMLSKDEFTDWEKSRHPEWMADFDLSVATKNYFAGDPGQFAARFLERSRRVCERIIAEKTWDAPKCQNAVTKVRGLTFRLKAYLSVFDSGRFDLEALRQASQDYEEWCLVDLKGTWTRDAVQQDYMTAILLSLFADDPDRAQRLIIKKKKYHFHLDFLDILKSIAANAAATPWPKSSEAFAKFTDYFDKVRDPDYQPKETTELSLRRLELGFIREKYYESQTGALDWQNVMAMIAG